MWVGIFTGLAQIGSFAKELTVAAWFGTGDALDAFLIALLVPTFMVNVLAGSLSASFLPTFIRVNQEKGISASQKMLAGIITWFIFWSFIASILLALLRPLYLPALCSGFPPDKLELTYRIFYFLLACCCYWDTLFALIFFGWN